MNINLDELAPIFISANTPLFLFRNLRRSRSVKSLAADYSSVDLMDRLREITRQPKLSHDDRILAYSILCSLTYKRSREWAGAMKKLNLSALEWGDEFVAFGSLPTGESNRISIEGGSPPSLSIYTSPGSTSVTIKDHENTE